MVRRVGGPVLLGAIVVGGIAVAVRWRLKLLEGLESPYRTEREEAMSRAGRAWPLVRRRIVQVAEDCRPGCDAACELLVKRGDPTASQAVQRAVRGARSKYGEEDDRFLRCLKSAILLGDAEALAMIVQLEEPCFLPQDLGLGVELIEGLTPDNFEPVLEKAVPVVVPAILGRDAEVNREERRKFGFAARLALRGRRHSVPAMLDVLRWHARSDRASVAYLIGWCLKWGAPQDEVRELAQFGDEMPRFYANAALAMAGEVQAVEALCSALADDRLYRLAAYFITTWAPHQGAEELRKELDSSGNLLRRAIILLSFLRDKSTLEKRIGLARESGDLFVLQAVATNALAEGLVVGAELAKEATGEPDWMRWPEVAGFVAKPLSAVPEDVRRAADDELFRNLNLFVGEAEPMADIATAWEVRLAEMARAKGGSGQ